MPANETRDTTVKPWCNYAMHRTTSNRRGTGSKRNKPLHGVSKKRQRRDIDDWWRQATTR